MNPPGEEVETADVHRPTGIYERSPAEGPLQQGEVLSLLVQQFLDIYKLKNDEFVVNETRHDFVIVVSQSCDLQWDYEARQAAKKADNQLPQVMLCEAHQAVAVKARDGMNSKLWDPIKKNKDERYHFFEEVPAHEDAVGEGIPELVVDFKRYFSISTEELYWKLTHQAQRRTRLKVPYLEHFATRFFQYQSRIATPRQHLSL